jgi:hypothetical protein
MLCRAFTVLSLIFSGASAFAADPLVTPDCRYVGPPTSAERVHRLTLPCVRQDAERQRIYSLMLDTDPLPAAPQREVQAPDPEPVMDLSTGRLLLIAPIRR